MPDEQREQPGTGGAGPHTVGGPTLTIDIGRDELVIRRRYETASIANDVLIGVLFLVGSILFFWGSTSIAATWLFVAGSVLMLIRPTIRLARRVHLTRRRGGDAHGAHETSMDF